MLSRLAFWEGFVGGLSTHIKGAVMLLSSVFSFGLETLDHASESYLLAFDKHTWAFDFRFAGPL